MTSTPDGIDERAFRFLCEVIRFVRTFDDRCSRQLVDQLVGASGSIAANRQEALGASSRREFVRFNEIALRGAKESTMWVRACLETGLGNSDTAAKLLEEAQQLARILGSIVVRTKKRSVNPNL
jgi:four helix bundle protein